MRSKRASGVLIIIIASAILLVLGVFAYWYLGGKNIVPNLSFDRTSPGIAASYVSGAEKEEMESLSQGDEVTVLEEDLSETDLSKADEDLSSLGKELGTP